MLWYVLIVFDLSVVTDSINGNSKKNHVLILLHTYQSELSKNIIIIALHMNECMR